jgi:glycosyltransferase involved in cell wall biosynthesis
MDITVIITAYNEEEYIQDAIDSVTSQTLSPDEVILVDGGSTDNTPDILRRYGKNHDQLSCVFLDKYVNIPEMRNVALNRASGDLISFLDGDDRFRPRKLELEMHTLENDKDASIVFSNTAYIDNEGKEIDYWADDAPVPTGQVLMENAGRMWPRKSLYRNAILPAELIESIGLYDPQIPIYEDWDLKIRTAACSKVAYCPEVLSEYRIHAEGVSTRSTAKMGYDCGCKVMLKNKPMLQNNLSDEEFQRTLQSMQSYLLELEIGMLKEQVNYAGAIKLHFEWVSQDIRRLFRLKSHVKHLFPIKWIANIQKLYFIYRRLIRNLNRPY